MTILTSKLPPRVHVAPLEQIPKALLEKSSTAVPDNFKKAVFSGLKQWKESSRVSDELLLQIAGISYSILSSDAIKSSSLAKKEDTHLPYSIIYSAIPKEVYFELDEFSEEKTGNVKKGSLALRITMKKASLVWEAKSRKLYDLTDRLQLPMDFELSSKEKPRICPKPYGHFVAIESQKSRLGVRQIIFSEQFKYDLHELSLLNTKTHPQTINYNQLFTITKQILQALDKLHTSGKSHGDIKPENIVVSESKETAVLIDFDNIGPKVSSIELTYGTAAYSAYEYLLPEGLTIDLQKADLFALGATIQITMTGHDPEWFRDLDIYFNQSDSLTEETKKIAHETAASKLLKLKTISDTSIELLQKGCKKDEFMKLLYQALLHPNYTIRPDAKTALTFYEKHSK